MLSPVNSVCRCGSTTIHHNHNFFLPLGVCDMRWLWRFMHHTQLGFTNCALSLGLPPTFSYFLIGIHLYAILSFGDCEVECPLDKRLETEVCMFFPMSAWNCSFPWVGKKLVLETKIILFWAEGWGWFSTCRWRNSETWSWLVSYIYIHTYLYIYIHTYLSIYLSIYTYTVYIYMYTYT